MWVLLSKQYIEFFSARTPFLWQQSGEPTFLRGKGYSGTTQNYIFMIVINETLNFYIVNDILVETNQS